MAYEDLFTDPMAAMGMGLLTSRENPLGTGAQLLQSASAEKRQREMSDLENQMKLMRALQPKLQFNPVTGEMFDMNTGTPFNPQGGGMTGADVSGGLGLPPKQELEVQAELRKRKALSEMPGTAEYKAIQEEQATQSAAQAKKQQLAEVLDRLVSNKKGVEDVTGAFDSWTPTFFPKSSEAKSDIAMLQNLLTLENLGALKGAMSDKDIAFLQSASAGQLDLSRPDVYQRIVDIRNKVIGDGGAQQGELAPLPTPRGGYNINDIEAEIQRRGLK